MEKTTDDSVHGHIRLRPKARPEEGYGLSVSRGPDEAP
jgi:hypothetical protein